MILIRLFVVNLIFKYSHYQCLLSCNYGYSLNMLLQEQNKAILLLDVMSGERLSMYVYLRIVVFAQLLEMANRSEVQKEYCKENDLQRLKMPNRHMHR